MRGKPHSDSSRAIAYVRVSTDDQKLGPVAQREHIERWAKTHRVSVVAWFEDLGVSGGASIEERHGLVSALAALKSERAGVLVVAKRDRLARDVMKAAIIGSLAERAGARIVAADGAGNGSEPADALMRTMIDAFAEYERALIGARTRAALAVKSSRGERVGQVPLGKVLAADGKMLAVDEAESRAIARAHELRAEKVSVRKIAIALGVEGDTPRGTRWHAKTVQRLLERA